MTRHPARIARLAPLAPLALLALLAGCGIDGPPRRPADTPPPGITISGEADIGLKYEI